MSKMIPATCVGNVVTAEGVPVPAAEVLSEGVGESSGVLILDEEEARYFAKISPDLKTLLEKVIEALEQSKTGFDQAVEALNQTALTFTATFAKMTGPTTAPPPTGPAGVVAIGVASALITTAGVQLAAIKVELQTLNGMLR